MEKPFGEESKSATHPFPLKLGVSYYGNRIPWRVKEDLEEIRRAGCTYVVHTFSEEDEEFYRPALEEIVKMTHALGMEVWLDPWGVGQAFGGETYSNLIAKDLGIRQIDSNGNSLPIACPNRPGFRDYLLRWIDAADSLRADVLFWDEPHFYIFPEAPGEESQWWACRCSACQEGYERKFGQPMPERLTPSVRQFKEDSLVEFVRFLCDATEARGMKASVCLLPFENSSTVNDWAKVAAIPSLSILGTDPYWKPRQRQVAEYVARFAQRIAELCHRYQKEPQLWILNFNIPKGEEDHIRQAIEAAWQAGIRNIAAWSYFGASYIKLRAEDPQTVWKTLGECYHRLRSFFD